jgi:hypothetical protein
VNSRVDILESNINLGITTLVDETQTVLNSTVGVFIRGFQSELAAALAPVPALASAIQNFGDCVLNLDEVLDSLDAVKELLRIDLLRVDLEMLRIDDVGDRVRNVIDEGQERVFGEDVSFADWIVGRTERIVVGVNERVDGYLWNFWFSFFFGLTVTAMGLMRLSVWRSPSTSA